ncbi:hypothetical protein [Aliikangiella sp. G2MR2-5]|uniref:hypothetical protein n=1 Tax=Aliikangiella sp. G2MR2-5 TaxID=2788943 RepID=UPI0018A8C18B|nr:hypothetical protein [Aliikangiella sp. G2MR2-5]
MSQVVEDFRQAEWDASRQLACYLPYQFQNKTVFKGFDARCGGCNRGILPHYLKGFIQSMAEDKCLLSSIGYCMRCNSVTYFDFIITAGKEMKVESVDLRNETTSYC